MVEFADLAFVAKTLAAETVLDGRTIELFDCGLEKLGLLPRCGSTITGQATSPCVIPAVARPPSAKPRFRIPELPENVHFLGICGRLVGGVALALQQLGVRVSGTDVQQYPPMPETLREAGIPVQDAWSPENLPAKTKAVVTGTVIPPSNPELQAALQRRLPIWNTTAFLEHYFLQRSQNFVVAGTKGKTTTTAMLAWILKSAGLAPDYLIGGQVRGALQRVRLTGAQLTVLEGDEFRSGMGDPMPKCLRYHPRHIVLTSVQHDHHELYPVRFAYESIFWDLMYLVPEDGTITANADDPRTALLAGAFPKAVDFVGFSRSAKHRLTAFRQSASGIRFDLRKQPFRLMLHGKTNAVDAALAAVAAEKAGVSLKESAQALETFPGVEGRLELLRSGRTLIYTDEAFHPIAVKPLLETLRKRHRGRRIVLILEPRYTGGLHGDCQKEFPDCVQSAGLVVLGPPKELVKFNEDFDQYQLCRQLKKRGIGGLALASMEDAVDQVPPLCREGDVIVISLFPGNDELRDRLCEGIEQALLRKK